MKIAAITDIHSSSSNLTKAIESINADKQIELVINCGDIGSPAIIQQLTELDKEQCIVLSAPDASNLRLIDACCRAEIDYFCDYGQLEIDGKKIGISHEKWNIPKNNSYDVVFYGHSHIYKTEQIDGTLFICCGEIMGRRMPPCYAIYDTTTNSAEKIDC